MMIEKTPNRNLTDLVRGRLTRDIDLSFLETPQEEERLLPSAEKKSFDWPMIAYGLASVLGTAATLGSDPYVAAGIGQGFSEGMKRWTDIQQQREELKQKKKYQDALLKLEQAELDLREQKAQREAEEARREAAYQALFLQHFAPQEIATQRILPPMPTGTGIIPPITHEERRLETPSEAYQRAIEQFPGLELKLGDVTIKAPEKKEKEIKEVYTLEDAIKERAKLEEAHPGKKFNIEKTVTGYTVSVEKEPKEKEDSRYELWLQGKLPDVTERERKAFEIKAGLQARPAAVPTPKKPTPEQLLTQARGFVGTVMPITIFTATDPAQIAKRKELLKNTFYELLIANGYDPSKYRGLFKVIENATPQEITEPDNKGWLDKTGEFFRGKEKPKTETKTKSLDELYKEITK